MCLPACPRKFCIFEKRAALSVPMSICERDQIPLHPTILMSAAGGLCGSRSSQIGVTPRVRR